MLCCVIVLMQELVSSSNTNPVLGDLFKHGQVVTARIWATNIGDKYESAGEMEGDQRRRCVNAACFVQSSLAPYHPQPRHTTITKPHHP